MTSHDFGYQPFPPLQRLHRALEAVAALSKVDRRTQLEPARRALRGLLGERRWLDRYCRGQPPFVRCSNGFLALHIAPRYTICVGHFPPRFRTGIHDHKLWGLVGTWAGEEIEERYAIEAEGPGATVRLRPTRIAVKPPGSICLLVPGVDEIHSVANVRRAVAYSFHVYGFGRDLPAPVPTSFTEPDAD